MAKIGAYVSGGMVLGNYDFFRSLSEVMNESNRLRTADTALP